ncbi:MAG: monovalent cation/H+ antiporter complex subunit F [Acidobacteriota bacterium]|nr:monovalent cation/H+ antiporter complex subunit F [Acidobacteriota bacterium]MDH3786299.1 monovalent cation/H+ antiporter complex subunit F [Acidobacteriota bacterium]
MMAVVVMSAILVTMSLALIRAMLGPTVFDRILALNMFGTKTVLLIAVISFVMGRPDFIDLALVYALMNFIGVLAVLRFSKHGHFGNPDDDDTTSSKSS